MEARALFDAYRRDRLDLPLDGCQIERLPQLRRHLPSDGGEAMLCFARLTPGTEAEQIAEQLAFFAARRQPFEWKVYEFDEPADLKPRLEAAGLVADDPELFMLYPLQGIEQRPAPTLPPGVEIRRIDAAAQLDDVLAVQAQVWGRDFEWLRGRLAESLAQADHVSMFCAYADGMPIGTGWTDYPEHSRFPELHGGSVVEGWRGRGVYGALFDIRFREARERGFEWMAVDASAMSEPILRGIGFLPICKTWPLRKTWG